MKHKFPAAAKFLTLALIAALLFGLAGCGGSDGETSTVIDIDKLAARLQEEITFQDQMSEVDSAVFFMLYDLKEEDVDTQVLISSTGATAEEIAIIHAASPDKTEGILAAVSGRVEAQREGFENYVPGELDKLADPVILQIGDYVILCVSDDNAKAEEILKEYK